MKILKYLFLSLNSLLSFYAGWWAYEMVLWLVWEQTISEGDLRAVQYWAGIAYLIILVPLYLLICSYVRSRIKPRFVRILLYPIGCAVIFVLPTLFIFAAFGGGNLFSAEAFLFYVFFISSGVVFGLGYALSMFLSLGKF
ncbi:MULTISPECIES: hypothetical protein [Paenibacillus]|uniref:hypothetical protein n=1 Tax=Paenibacillus TaxID=44249 RepID=UPI00034EB562|nr:MULTISPECIES: hypothetical protein [Paenibacillus]EPD88881.1 hypothetical protein HMPREF1207_01832 [Paenibacillus sp. HGH0039]MBV6717301.1 hypothetical protein [Paenibacillus chitinolyticus]